MDIEVFNEKYLTPIGNELSLIVQHYDNLKDFMPAHFLVSDLTTCLSNWDFIKESTLAVFQSHLSNLNKANSQLRAVYIEVSNLERKRLFMLK